MKKILIIIFLGLMTYFPVLLNGFVWDDEEVFQKGRTMLTDNYFRPAISAFYSTILNIFGSNPFFFHLFQLILHILTAILIFHLLKRFLKEITAIVLAIIFLVHPANVEAVSFASAMQEVAFTLTGLIGLYLFVNLGSIVIPAWIGDDTINNTYIKIFLGTLFLLIALLMKETAIVFFVLVFCYLIIFRKKQTNVILSYSVFAVIFLITYLIVRISNGNLYAQGQGLFPIMRASLITRLMNIPMIILYYLGKFCYPMNLAIAQHWVVRTINYNNFFLPLVLEVPLFVSAIIYIIKSKNKVFIFFFLWFILGLLPHLQIIPLNMTVAERWLYFPMIGLLGMMGAIISEFRIKNLELRINYIGIIIIIISIFSVRSFIRTLDWRNGLSLFSRDIRKDSSFDLQNNMGVELFRTGRYDEAKKYFEISTKLAPYWWVNWNNLGAIYEHEKNYQKAAKYYQRSIDNGQYYLANENLEKLLIFHGKDLKNLK